MGCVSCCVNCHQEIEEGVAHACTAPTPEERAAIAAELGEWPRRVAFDVLANGVEVSTIRLGGASLAYERRIGRLGPDQEYDTAVFAPLTALVFALTGEVGTPLAEAQAASEEEARQAHADFVAAYAHYDAGQGVAA